MLPALLALTALLQDPAGASGSLLDPDLAGWMALPAAPGAWQVSEGVLRVRGSPEGMLRTHEEFGDFQLTLEWRRPEAGPAPGILVWADSLPGTGAAWPDGLRLPLEAGGGWHSLQAEGRAGELRLTVDGTTRREPVRAPAGPSVRGHLAILADGAPLELRGVRLQPGPGGRGMESGQDWLPLFNTVDLSGWRGAEEAREHWLPRGRILHFDGQGDHLWTVQSFRDLELVVDWRWPADPVEREVPVVLPDGSFARDERGRRRLVRIADAGDSGVFLRGDEDAQVNLWCWPIGSGGVYGYRTDASLPAEVRSAVTPRMAADRPLGEWNRLHLLLRGGRLTVRVNEETVVEDAALPGLPAEGPLGLQAHGTPVEFTNLLVRPLTAEPTTRPAPNEHRPGRLARLAEEVRIHRTAPLLFVGDGSVEQFATRGRAVWARFYGSRDALNLGLDWERTENLLWRIQRGDLDGLRPRVVILEIGGENLASAGHQPRQVEAGVRQILAEMRRRLPGETRFLLLGILPRGARAGDPLRQSIRETNALLGALADGVRVRFLDPGWALTEADGSLSREVFWDGHHLTVLGYRLLAVAIEPELRRLLGEDE